MEDSEFARLNPVPHIETFFPDGTMLMGTVHHHGEMPWSTQRNRLTIVNPFHTNPSIFEFRINITNTMLTQWQLDENGNRRGSGGIYKRIN